MASSGIVEIQMPQMGESVTEGTVLEWHKQEGEFVEEGETVVEVSTDKVDAEVPAPASGTITKILKGEDEAIEVGGVLAELDPTGASRPGTARRGGRRRASAGAARRRRPAPAEAPSWWRSNRMPEMGESVAEGTILEWHKQEGDPVEEGETVVEVSTDKVDAEVPAPASGTITKIRAQADETVKVGQVLAEMTPAPHKVAPPGLATKSRCRTLDLPAGGAQTRRKRSRRRGFRRSIPEASGG